ncbi:hypothetical protein ACHAXA_008207 [Cyclostephanos tholiformis]|uniref:Protein LTV1 homolog n=1 Tax=Cyclostephanos tholiformis TaxID=382380 RepID=A0ABD3SCR8_9STRA
MGKKKPFIDKKTAMVYHVVRRSQRDIGTEATAETLTDFVLMPSPENAVRGRDAGTGAGRTPAATASSSSRGTGGGKRREVVDFRDLESRIAAAGLLDETAKTYARYTKPIEKSGTFVPALSNAILSSSTMSSADVGALNDLLTDTSRNALDDALEEAMAVREVGRMLDSIALTPDCMEEDVAAALFGDFDDGDFEELDDDFCITANSDVPINDDGCGGGGGEDGNDGGFDFERHVRMLMEKARANENGGNCVGARDLDDDFFDGVAPLRRRGMEDDDEDDFDYDRYDEDVDEEDEEYSLDRQFDGASTSATANANANNDERQRILCQRFEEALLEYDSDEVGDLDDECEDIVGDRPLEGDACLEAALNEFLTEREDEILIEGTGRNAARRKRRGGSSYSVLVGKTMLNASELNKIGDGSDPISSSSLLVNVEESKRQMQLDLAEADAILANPEMDLPPEEIFIDGKSYFSVTSRNPWDCESILSTYSNLDNNPVIIGRSGRRGRRKKGGGNRGEDTSNDVIPEDKPVRIRLSNKTGLPLRPPSDEGIKNNNDNEDYFGEGSTYLSINRGEARQRDESKQEKRERKMAVKEERRVCRMQKKIMKEAFSEEFQRRGHDVVVDPVGGSTVFRFS